jgi:hypothetical protein
VSQPIGFCAGELSLHMHISMYSTRLASNGHTPKTTRRLHGMALLEATRKCATGTTATAISGQQQQLASTSFLEDDKTILHTAARAGLQHRPADSSSPSHPRRLLFVSMHKMDVFFSLPSIRLSIAASGRCPRLPRYLCCMQISQRNRKNISRSRRAVHYRAYACHLCLRPPGADV